MSMPETRIEPKDNQLLTDEPLALVYCTFPSLELAKAAAGTIIAQRLAACVNILPGMTAIYEWDGHLHEASEVSVILKTRRALIDAVFAAVIAHHTHANPALLSLEVHSSPANYFAWVIAQTEKHV
jgi:periplasmic divalent cation tolerance protein